MVKFSGSSKSVSIINRGAVALINDDAVADKGCIERLACVQGRDTIATGRRMIHEWAAEKPAYLSEGFYGPVRVTHRGLADGSSEARNSFSSKSRFGRTRPRSSAGSTLTSPGRGATRIFRTTRLSCVHGYVRSTVRVSGTT